MKKSCPSHFVLAVKFDKLQIFLCCMYIINETISLYSEKEKKNTTMFSVGFFFLKRGDKHIFCKIQRTMSAIYHNCNLMYLYLFK